MPQEIAPIAVRPSTLSGISEQMVVSHYENTYGNAVRTLNAVHRELAALDAGTPPHRLRGLKREELSLMGSVALHELYFGNLGGFRRAGPNSGLGRPDWHEVPDDFATEIAADFADAVAWRREFVAMAQSLASGSGWVVLTYSRRQKRFWNQIATDHTQAAVDAAPDRRDRVELIGIAYPWPNISLIHGFDHVFGHNPLRLETFAAATGVGDTVATPDQRTFSPLYPSYRSPFADLFGVRFIATGVPVENIDSSLKPGNLTLVARTADAYVYENPRALPRVFLVTAWRLVDFAELIRDGYLEHDLLKPKHNRHCSGNWRTPGR